MPSWYIVSGLVTLDAPNTPQQVLRIPTHDDNVRNHHANLIAQGFRVIDIKILPWYDEPVDALYDTAPTPGMGELLDENTDTNKATGSSN